MEGGYSSHVLSREVYHIATFVIEFSYDSNTFKHPETAQNGTFLKKGIIFLIARLFRHLFISIAISQMANLASASGNPALIHSLPYVDIASKVANSGTNESKAIL